MKVMLVSEIDRRTNKIRRGPYLRYKYPPKGIKYTLHKDILSVFEKTSHYEFNSGNVLATISRLLLKGFSQPIIKDEKIIHSFFWNFYLYSRPWIHENDESPSQFLDQYYGGNGFTYNLALDFLTYYLNSSPCRAIITWSEWARKGFVKDGVDSSKVVVIPPPMPLNHEKKINHDGINILFIGRDFIRKGGDIVLKVFTKLSKEFDNINLIYVGSLPDKIKNIVTNFKNIYYLNKPNDNDLYNKILPSSDIIFLPTRYDAYALTILESMSYGLPIVASDINSIKETVIHGQNGFLANDEHSFEKYLALLIMDEKIRKSFGENSVKIVKEKHDPETIGKELSKVYENVLSGL